MLEERSNEKELIDLGPDYYSQDEYSDCLKKLFYVNKFFGFFKDTVKILRKFPKESSLLDVGCGGGLFILNLSKHFPKMQLLGMDIAAAAIAEAQQNLSAWKKNLPDIRVSFQLQKQQPLDFSKNVFDIILITLVCHHLKEDELVNFLRQAYGLATKAVIINDLHRHRLAHWFFGLMSPWLFRNRLISHDGLISIRRGFIRCEWQQLLRQAGIRNYQLKWCFPFRWQLVLWK